VVELGRASIMFLASVCQERPSICISVSLFMMIVVTLEYSCVSVLKFPITCLGSQNYINTSFNVYNLSRYPSHNSIACVSPHHVIAILGACVRAVTSSTTSTNLFPCS